jgi:hypothetical protein
MAKREIQGENQVNCLESLNLLSLTGFWKTSHPTPLPSLDHPLSSLSPMSQDTHSRKAKLPLQFTPPLFIQADRIMCFLEDTLIFLETPFLR